MTFIPGRNEFLEILQGDCAKAYIADNFAKYAHWTELTRFLARYELFKLVANVKGSICECGLKSGAGFMQWCQLTRLLDPLGANRDVIGFDTFKGFPSISGKDGAFPKVGDLSDTPLEELIGCVKMHFGAAALENTLLIEGDFMETADVFIKNNPHCILALLFLDFDLYDPTKKALEVFLPRMPRGAVIAFDEINNRRFPGETSAVLEIIGIKNLELKTFSFNPDVCYHIL